MQMIATISRWSSRLSYSGATSSRHFHASYHSLYRYQRLQNHAIRLIDLCPGKDAESLHCKLRNVSIAGTPRYEALSYCWGTDKPEAEIHCENESIPVTKNLFAALQRLRLREEIRTLWIDAVSINQSDVTERNQQVSMMKNIFEQSGRTIVWLGEDTKDSRCAFQLIQRLVQASHERKSHRSWTWSESTQLPPLYDPSWRGFSLLLQRPWFHRAWIVQETSVSKDILLVCGDDSVLWEDLVRAVQYAIDLGVFIAYGGSTTYQALRLFETRTNFQKGNLLPLHQVLLRNRSFLATDARDKVFGLLSLAAEGDVKAMNLRPNYHLSVEQLYKDISLSLLQQPNLSAFSASGVHDSIIKRVFPSWVSDWSTSDPSVPLDSQESYEHQDKGFYNPNGPVSFNASNSTTSSPTFDDHKTLLGLEGLLVDQVEIVGVLSRTRYLRHVSHMFELFVQCHDTLEQLKDWETVAQTGLRKRYRTGEKLRDAYWHTLSAGRVPQGLPTAIRDPRFKYYIMIRSLRRFVRATIRWFPRSEKDTWYNRLFYSMFQGAWRVFGLTPAKIQRIGFPPESRLSNHRRMVRTRGGYIALVPRYTRAGDWVGIFRGGKMPLVIRKEGDHWVLVGESYVHGMMNGEAWDEAKCELMWFK